MLQCKIKMGNASTKQPCWRGIKPKIFNGFYTRETFSVFMILTNITVFNILKCVYVKFLNCKR